MAWLLLAQPWDDSISATRSLYFSDRGFVTEPTESPANTYWDRRIEVPFRFTQSLYAGTAVSGRSEVSAGSITLANDDGALDALADYDWDGRLVELRHTSVAKPVLADFALVFSGVAERIVLGDELQIEIRDLQALLDEPFQPDRYAGTGGQEGPAEFEGRRKPTLLGRVRQFQPIMLDSATLLYAFGAGPVGGILALRDAGVTLTAGTDHATFADLAAATVAGGTYHTCNALALFRLGSLPVGVLTADADGAAPGGTVLRTFAALAVHVIDRATTLGAGDFATGTVAAMNTTAPQHLGWWDDGGGEVTVRQVLDRLAASVGAHYGFGIDRKITLGRLDAPAVTPDLVLTDRDVVRLEPREVARRLKAQVVRWGRRWRPLRPDEIAGSVSDTLRAEMQEEWRQASNESAPVAAASLLAREETEDSVFDSATDAADEAARRVALYGARRAAFAVDVASDVAVTVGQTVELRDARYGLSAGKRFRVLELSRDVARDTLTLEVWG
ncbi:MAG TPA: hypothetical protein VGN96_15810 [Roseococcus sp.]|jgi:hypothetical protein|nr:hypothetical protein [Roseococcus sp.]